MTLERQKRLNFLVKMQSKVITMQNSIFNISTVQHICTILTYAKYNEQHYTARQAIYLQQSVKLALDQFQQG